MGTFHDTKDPLHGITIVAHMGDTIHVGRCHERNDCTMVMLDVDSHTQDESGKGPDGRTNAEYLNRVAKFGVWAKSARMILPVSKVESIVPLSQYFKRPGQKTTQSEIVVTETFSKGTPEELKPLAASTSRGDQAVSLTEAACNEVRKLLAAEEKPDQGLRLSVSGGGCSGMVYKVEFDLEKEGDIVIPFDGFSVLLDRKSTIYLRGIVLDHENGLGGKGFQFNNPNATNTCGCGESFSV